MEITEIKDLEKWVDIDGGIAYPIVYARKYSNGVQLTFRCEFCKTNHYHGRCSGTPDCKFNMNRPSSARNRCRCPKGSGDGHRVAHCIEESSYFYERGYVLREV